MHLDARPSRAQNEIKCGDFGECFSTNVLSTVKSVIHFVQHVARYTLWFSGSVHLDARPSHARNEIKCGDFGECFSTNVLSTVKSVIHFVQHVARYDLWFSGSVHLDAQPSHAQNEIKCGDFGGCFFNQRIINRQECCSFRATSCTLQFMIFW